MEAEAKPYVLSIAGFDPSGGAGVLADIKTFESNKIFGLGVCTALTFQNDREFEGVNWVKTEDILKQLNVLFRRFQIRWVKIGLIESMEVLDKIIEHLYRLQSSVKIVWDPILKASAGFVFHEGAERRQLENICRKIYLLTPNLEEVQHLIPEMDPESGAQYLSGFCNVLLKGGHSTGQKAKDILFAHEIRTVFESDKINGTKHGTGCVLSASITSHLAMERDIREACGEGKEYVTDFIRSDSGLLGFHYA